MVRQEVRIRRSLAHFFIATPLTGTTWSPMRANLFPSKCSTPKDLHDHLLGPFLQGYTTSQHTYASDQASNAQALGVQTQTISNPPQSFVLVSCHSAGPFLRSCLHSSLRALLINPAVRARYILEAFRKIQCQETIKVFNQESLGKSNWERPF